MSGLTPLSPDDFNQKVLSANLPVLVEFGAPWCSPCHQLEPELAALAEDMAGEAHFYRVDVDEEPQLVLSAGVMGVPTVVLYQNGEITKRMSGFRPRQMLKKIFFGD